MVLNGLWRGELYLFTCRWCSYLRGNTPMALHVLLQVKFYSLICRWSSYLTGNTYMGPPLPVTRTAVFFLYIDDVPISQERHLRTFTACYGDSLIIYIQMVFVPYRTHTYWPPRPVTWIALFFICRWCSYLKGHTRTGLHGILQG
jgi:hypothetical protein